MKKILAVILVLALGVSLCACSTAEKPIVAPDAPESETQEIEMAPEEDIIAEDAGADKPEEKRELLGNYVDVEAYEKADGTIEANKLEYSIDTVTVDDAVLCIGMTYEDITAAGFRPVYDALPEKELGDDWDYYETFENNKGKRIEIGFCKPDGADEAATIKDGQVCAVYINCWRNKLGTPAFDMDGITGNTALTDALEKLGSPYRITDIDLEDRQAVQFEYRSAEPDSSVIVIADLETEEILSVAVDSYTV